MSNKVKPNKGDLVKVIAVSDYVARSGAKFELLNPEVVIGRVFEFPDETMVVGNDSNSYWFQLGEPGVMLNVFYPYTEKTDTITHPYWKFSIDELEVVFTI